MGGAYVAWRDTFGRLLPAVSIGRSAVDRGEQAGALQIATRQSLETVTADMRWRIGVLDMVRAGVELERDNGLISGQLPAFFYRRNSGDPVRAVDGGATLTRRGAFLEGSWQLGPHWRLGPSVRVDDSDSFDRRATFDSRVSIAYRVDDRLSLTAAAGQYTQRPDALALARGTSIPSSIPQATHFIAGAQRETGSLLLRVEVFEKRYRHLVQFDRQRQSAYEGRGLSRGSDGFMRWAGAAGVSVRSTLSLLSATRTDPDGRLLARAPNDISHSLASVVEKSWKTGWRLALAYRDAAGRPFTPVTGADQLPPDGTSDRINWLPRYGTAFSAELPRFRRYDASLSFRRPFGRASQAVYTLSMTNLFDRRNTSGVSYDTTYSERRLIRSPVKRMIFAGFSLTWLK